MGKDVGTADFEARVVERSKVVPVVVDFWAEWCGPCRTLGPVLEDLDARSGGAWELVKVDVDAAPELAQRFGIQGIPAVKAFRGGQVVDEFVGAQPRAQVERWLKGVVPSPADQLAEKGDEASLRAALALDGRHPLARARLAELLADRDPEAARALLPEGADGEAGRIAGRVRSRLDAQGLDRVALEARIAANPGDLEARWDLARALAAVEDYEGALAHLLEIVKRSRKFRDDAARKEMLRLFEVVGARSPLADRWRDQLAHALF